MWLRAQKTINRIGKALELEAVCFKGLPTTFGAMSCGTRVEAIASLPASLVLLRKSYFLNLSGPCSP